MPRCRLLADASGAAAAEMVMVLPIFFALLFGAFETGSYFWSEHKVQEAVRDAARFASRLPASKYAGCAVDAGAAAEVQGLARTGDPDPDGTTPARLAGWTDNAMTSVEVACDTSGTYSGIYAGFAQGVPVVTVKAVVPYQTLFGQLGLGSAGTCAGNNGALCLTLQASSQAAVAGA